MQRQDERKKWEKIDEGLCTDIRLGSRWGLVSHMRSLHKQSAWISYYCCWFFFCILFRADTIRTFVWWLCVWMFRFFFYLALNYHCFVFPSCKTGRIRIISYPLFTSCFHLSPNVRHPLILLASIAFWNALVFPLEFLSIPNPNLHLHIPGPKPPSFLLVFFHPSRNEKFLFRKFFFSFLIFCSPWYKGCFPIWNPVTKVVIAC